MADDTNTTGVDVSARLVAIDERLTRGAQRMAALEKQLQANTEATKRTEANTKDLVEFFNAMQGAFKVLQWIGKAARPVGWIVGTLTAIAGLVALLKGGGSPK